MKFKYCGCFYERKNFKDDLIEHKRFFLTLIVNTSLTKSYRNDFSMHRYFLTTITISSAYCCEKVFILTNIWMIGKKINKTSLPEKEHFYSNLNMEDITDAGWEHV